MLDEFSDMAFSYEWKQVPLHPVDWPKQLEHGRLELLFIESAWRGNAGAWRSHLAGETAPRKALVELLSAARDRGIPSVFWNKEDPPHYDDFLETARLFDYVLTTDARKVADYRTALGHDRVGVMPFAAQPKIHNPIREPAAPRTRTVMFGGMYFRHKFPERREQLDHLLAAATDLGLDIFSRQYGGDKTYQFPSRYEPHVRGALPYDEMLSAYKAYKVVLNANSVVDSPSMCARRLFEATASGAAVLSGPSDAIAHFFPKGEIRIATSEQDAALELRTLLRSEEYRLRLVHQAQREIWRTHTYGHRVRTVLSAIGIQLPRIAPPRISIVAPTFRPHNLPKIIANAARQQNVDVQLVIVQHGFDLTDEVEHRARAAGIDDCLVLSLPRDASLGQCLNLAVTESTGEYVARMDDDDFYGPAYLEDLVHAHHYSDADLLGKGAAYCYLEALDATALLAPERELTWTTLVRGSTFFGPRSTFAELPFQDVGASEDTLFLRSLRAKGGRIFATDRFNFCINRSAETQHHTWSITDKELLASGIVQFYGKSYESVTV